MQVAQLYENLFRLAKQIPDQKSNVDQATELLNHRSIMDRIRIYKLFDLRRKMAEQRENDTQVQEYKEILDHYAKNILD